MKTPDDAVSAAGRIDPIVDLLLTETREVCNGKLPFFGLRQDKPARPVVALVAPPRIVGIIRRRVLLHYIGTGSDMLDLIG